MTEPAITLCAITIGSNPVTLWGLTMAERGARLARASGLVPVQTCPGAACLMMNAGFAYDPAWFRYFASQPGLVLTIGGVPVLAHARSADAAREIEDAMMRAEPLPALVGHEMLDFEQGPTIENKQLRKRETPFVMALRSDTVRALERASYFGAYKGVTDVLTKYLWPEWALVLTRIAARIGMTPNMVTAIGAALCVYAAVLFAQGQYWLGMAAGLGFMVLDTVDGKLARCTITSSWWGNIFDHGLDLVHPPFWWWFWATGLGALGLAYDQGEFGPTFWWVQGAIQGGYLVQRGIEGVFMRQNGMMHIHVWQRFDSAFRLVTARRNPNMVILFASMLFSRPDLGLIAVAWWTGISCGVHAVRLVQAWAARARGQMITSWLSGDAA